MCWGNNVKTRDSHKPIDNRPDERRLFRSEVVEGQLAQAFAVSVIPHALWLFPLRHQAVALTWSTSAATRERQTLPE